MIPQEDRIFYMDNVRALAMMLGIFFHAALPYGTLLHEVWIISDRAGNSLMDVGAWFTHMFRMPLFFIVAGFFAHLLRQKRGTGGLLKNRACRILLPFIIFWPIIGISMLVLMVHAVKVITVKAPLLQLIADMMNDPEADTSPISTTHLWFLYQLIWFYLLVPIFLKLNLQSISRHIDRVFSGVHPLLWLPLLFTPAMIVNPVPLPAPERIYPQLWSFAYFGLFFLFGWALFSRRGYLDQIMPYWKHLLFTGIVLYAGFYSMLPDISLEAAMDPPTGYDLSLWHMTLATVEAYASVYLTLAFLLLGKCFLDIRHGLLRYIADSSYWVYIIHLPVLMLIQIHLSDASMSIWVKFLISSTATIAIGFLSYAILVRHTPVGWLLNGRKRQKKEVSSVHVPAGKHEENTTVTEGQPS